MAGSGTRFCWCVDMLHATKRCLLRDHAEQTPRPHNKREGWCYNLELLHSWAAHLKVVVGKVCPGQQWKWSHQFDFGQKWYSWKEWKKEKNRGWFEMFLLCLWFLIKFSKTAVLRGNRRKMPKICGNPLGNRPRGLLASYWLKTW